MPTTKKRKNQEKENSKSKIKLNEQKALAIKPNKKLNNSNKKSINSNEKIIKKKIPLWKPFLIAVLAFLISLTELFLNGDTITFWIFFVLSIIIIIPNLIWLKLGLGKIFGLPFIATMLKTKYFIRTIENLSKHARILELISIWGLFVGFGLAGIDYWVAREKGGWKRILILIIGAIGLYLLFEYTLKILFLPPALAPLLTISLITFILLGLGGLSIGILVGYAMLSVSALFSSKQICPSIFPVLPGVPIPGIGTIVPLIAWVSLGMILVVHEFSHGILLVKYKEKIRSVGLILFGLVPMGAFVEQEDKSFLKRPEKKQILVLSAGPSSNLFTMLIGIILLLLFVQLTVPINTEINNEYAKTYSGINVVSVEETISLCGISEKAPAKDKLFEEDIILKINNNDVNSINVIINEIRNSEEISFLVLRNGIEEEVEIEPYLFEDMNLRRIGVMFGMVPTGYEPPFGIQIASIIIQAINSILFFFAILSFAVGMFNFLPSDPLDGGRIAKFVLLPYFSFLKMNKKETMKFIGRLFAWIFLISILLNLLPYLTMFIL
jgi:membrane-associated protease RseP (regulator of RpoE activity)